MSNEHQTRWTLSVRSCRGLRVYFQIFSRLGLSYKRARIPAEKLSRIVVKTQKLALEAKSRDVLSGVRSYIGALNPHTGDVVYQQVKSCTVVALHTFYTQICQRYPNAERIYLIQDNRAIHFHANLRANFCHRRRRPTPPNWSGETVSFKLPNACWTNPIEKLSLGRQAVIHLHCGQHFNFMEHPQRRVTGVFVGLARRGSNPAY